MVDIKMLEEEYDRLEEVTLDDFIVVLQELSLAGYGEKLIVNEITGGLAFPFYDKKEDKFLL